MNREVGGAVGDGGDETRGLSPVGGPQGVVARETREFGYGGGGGRVDAPVVTEPVPEMPPGTVTPRRGPGRGLEQGGYVPGGAVCVPQLTPSADLWLGL